jgi:hypothetical protein
LTAARSVRAPWFVVAGRVLLLLGAAMALASGVVHARSHDRAALASAQRYVCPMHPEVKSSAPGNCPICKMALVPARERAMLSALAVQADPAMPEGEQVVATAEARTVARQVRAPAWVERDGQGTALLYEDDLVGLAADEHAHFYAGTSRSAPVDVHLSTGERQGADASTAYVRFRLDHPLEHAEDARDAACRPEVGSLWIEARARRLLTVPTSALLYSARGPYVLASRGSLEGRGGFARRFVRTGRILDSGYVGALAGRQLGAVVVLSGLEEGEKVIAGRPFFADAERRLREASGMPEEAMR